MIRLPLLLVTFGACTAAAPTTPSFQQDVLPILAANCVRCHGYPALGGGPSRLRLDSYSDIATDDDNVVTGAAINASSIALRAGDDERPMPPRFPLDAYQRETLDNWAAQVPAGEPAPRGEPRPNNRPPTIEISAIDRDAATVLVQARVTDADGDLVAGELRVGIDGSDRIVGPVRSGAITIAWSTTAITPGLHPLTAHLDDGADIHVIPLGTIAVEAP